MTSHRRSAGLLGLLALACLSGLPAVEGLELFGPRPASGGPDATNVNYALLKDVRDKPASYLNAMARQARDEGRFADAVYLLQTALDSPYGRERFGQQLKEAVAATNRRMNQEARGPLFEHGFSLPAKGDIMMVLLFEPARNATMGTTRVRYEMRSLLDKPFDEKWHEILLRRITVVLKEELDRRMPGNLLEYTSSHQMYYLEGWFNSEYPRALAETNLELGLVYKETQDYVLSRHHLEAALGQKAFLGAPQREWQARYALAEIQVIQGKLYDYEKTLKQIVSNDRDFTNQEGAVASRRQQMKLVLLGDQAGLDKMLQFYRLPDDFSLSAHRQLATMYLQRHNNEQALTHAIFAVIKPVSHAMELVRDVQYGYVFSTMEDFLTTARQYPEIREYLEQTGLYESLYTLSQVVVGYQPGDLRVPRAIWGLLARLPEAGSLRAEAAECLRRTARPGAR